MRNIIKGILFLTFSGSITCIVYGLFGNGSKSLGFIDSDNQPYRKTNGTVIAKEIRAGKPVLVFSYPEGTNTSQGIQEVSERQFDKTKVGDKLAIFYAIYAQSKWLPVWSGKIFWGGIILAVVASIMLLLGVYNFSRAFR